MVKFGNFIFKYRNLLFPFLFLSLVFSVKPSLGSKSLENARYVIGVMVALAGQTMRALTIGLAYIKRGGKNRKIYAKELVKEGIFAHCRNPLYLGNVLIITGLGIVAQSFLFVLIGIPLFIFQYMAIIRAEEHFLTSEFGQDYMEYCRSVNRFIPKFSGIGKTLKGMKFRWKRLIVKEYGTTYVWIICVILLIMRNQYVRYGNLINGSVILISSQSFIFVTGLYTVAWYLKKRRLLVAD